MVVAGGCAVRQESRMDGLGRRWTGQPAAGSGHFPLRSPLPSVPPSLTRRGRRAVTKKKRKKEKSTVKKGEKKKRAYQRQSQNTRRPCATHLLQSGTGGRTDGWSALGHLWMDGFDKPRGTDGTDNSRGEQRAEKQGGRIRGGKDGRTAGALRDKTDGRRMDWWWSAWGSQGEGRTDGRWQDGRRGRAGQGRMDGWMAGRHMDGGRSGPVKNPYPGIPGDSRDSLRFCRDPFWSLIGGIEGFRVANEMMLRSYLRK
jgi:hypothetical protein